MPAKLIFLPMGAMALLTFIVLHLIPFRRFQAGFRKEVTYKDLRLGESDRVPEGVRLPNRNFMNLLEIPQLFHIVCLMYYVANAVTPITLGLAWVFVALRAAHSLIHLTYNNVVHRLTAFAASNVALIALWAAFFIT